jgi:crotonobetainyl-CoA:carnitine CoA-transferase CaiB-like acyl-CoA transferase
MGVPSEPDPLLGRAWDALTTDMPPAGWRPAVEISGPRGLLPSHLAVEETAECCVALALMAAAGLHRVRAGSELDLSIARGQVAAAVRSERYFRRGDSPAGAGFAPLSRFWRTADGWIRTHANYPWHRAALLKVLDTGPDPDTVQATLAGLEAEEVEQAIVSAGGVAAAVRTQEAWSVHPQGQAIADEPLVGYRCSGDAPPRRQPPGTSGRPAAGIRVLDMTRVIAGPVCTRFLAALGADVLRLDPPSRPDLSKGQPSDTLLGKRSALVDFDSADGRRVLYELLGEADVVVCGYRPGSLDRFGLDEDDLSGRYPGLVVLYVSAWGFTGPWRDRRGFDSVVQAPTGIAMIESPDGREPGALPCQLLDHGTGYLGAAAVLDGLRRQFQAGGTHVRRVSLARTAQWLTSVPPRPVTSQSVPAHSAGAIGRSASPADPGVAPWLVELAGPHGPVHAVGPPGRIAGHPLQWPGRAAGYGDGPPAWP